MGDYNILAKALEKLEIAEQVSLGDFKCIEPFGSTELFSLCDFIDANITPSWNRVDLTTGKVAREVQFFVGDMQHIGHLLYCRLYEGDILAVISVEESFGVFLAKDTRKLHMISTLAPAATAEFHYSLDWNRRLAKNPQYIEYLSEWTGLSEKFPGCGEDLVKS